jgi:cell division protein FtsQ
MKRPEGFDPPGRSQPPPPGRKPSQPSRVRASGSTHPSQTKPARPAESAPPPAAATVPRPSQQPRPDPAARAELRSAARARRKYERAEVRRFTRRARNRRVAVALVLGTMASLVIIILAAIFSPILALRQIQIDGTSRVSAEEVHSAVDGQLGTPLALIDYGKLTAELGAFPLIRSYVTEIVPPDTLLIHIVERQPVGAVLTGGTYHLVDPAGVTVQESSDRLPGVPLIDIGGASTSGVVFDSVVEVLLSLPPELLAQVDSVSATTQDDVSLVLTGVGQRVTWGSADQSQRKAALLTALIAQTDPASAGEFDVSAPNNGVFRPS